MTRDGAMLFRGELGPLSNYQPRLQHALGEAGRLAQNRGTCFSIGLWRSLTIKNFPSLLQTMSIQSKEQREGFKLAEKFNLYRFADHNQHVTDLLNRVHSEPGGH